MLTEKLAKGLTEQQLRELIIKQGKKANRNITTIRAKGLGDLSGVMQAKIEPYLRKHGRTNKHGEQVFKLGAGKNATKQDMIDLLLNIQYFNSRVGTASKVVKRAKEQAKRFAIDLTDVKKFWKLYEYGYNAVGYRVDSEVLQEIIKNRLRAGQKESSIKAAIRRAADAADNADDYLTKFSGSGRWI